MGRGRIADFYEGKTLLITGASGFLGCVLLESLLRCFPGLNAVYVVLREKKGVSPRERRGQIFEKMIYKKLASENPDALEKVRVLSGDTSAPDMGLSYEDLQTVFREVSIIFHVAAAISFTKPMVFTLKQNVLSVKYAIDLCRKLENLEAFVYTSTAFGNMNKPLDTIEEIVYRLPYHSDYMLQKIQENDEESLIQLSKVCGPPWKNNYLYSKCVAENLLQDTASDLPVVIVRPSIIVCCWKGHLPGWAEESSGIALLMSAVGRGFVRVIPNDPNMTMDFTPVDVVANAHILAAVKISQQRPRCSPLLVVNCATRMENRISLAEMSEFGIRMSLDNPLPHSYQLPQVRMCSSRALYWYHALLSHYAPAVVIDAILWISGKKTRLFHLYRFYEKTTAQFTHFSDFDQEDTNLLALADGLDPQDKETFYVDQATFRLSDLGNEIPLVLPMYTGHGKRKETGTIEQRRSILYWRSKFTLFIKYCVLSLMGYILYTILHHVGRLAGFI